MTDSKHGVPAVVRWDRWCLCRARRQVKVISPAQHRGLKGSCNSAVVAKVTTVAQIWPWPQNSIFQGSQKKKKNGVKGQAWIFHCKLSYKSSCQQLRKPNAFSAPLCPFSSFSRPSMCFNICYCEIILLSYYFSNGSWSLRLEFIPVFISSGWDIPWVWGICIIYIYTYEYK